MVAFLLGMDHAETKIEFEDIGEIIPEPVSFEEAEKLFMMRITMTKKEWQDIERQMRFRAFTVARLTELDAIEAVRRRVLKAIEEGKTLQQFWQEAGKDELLKRAGFHRGNPWYWETVFRTNIQTAYNAGRAYQFKKNPPAYYEFVGITDVRQTPTCRARSGIIRPATDPFWSTNWPPLHFNCRSTIRAVHKEEYKGLGLKVSEKVPGDMPRKGFGMHPLESGSYWRLTPKMIERAKKYGIYDEIEKVAEELGFKLNRVKTSQKP
ncbi:MAG TPA: phage minor head protein [Candidatus Hydrothermia bacterium]|nr:phage minor head protein [Candidatus Hydrothermia bacterium]